jgi:aspartyl-tRNA(Asn)/glutamyl-tRNA(Gln) amidotransferase subunit C
VNTHGSPKYATFRLSLKPLIEMTRMSLDQEDVSRIAHLARLGVDESEYTAYAHNLSAILAFVEQLNAVDTTGVEAMAHPLDASQRLRRDQVSEADQREKFQRVAPRVEAGLYLVPKVIE